MSADNGVYILVSPNKKTGFTEYRVIHTMAIENIYYQPDYGEYNKEYLIDYFGKCKFNTSDIEALAYARKLSERQDYIEYGIKYITMDREFPKMPTPSRKYKQRKRRTSPRPGV